MVYKISREDNSIHVLDIESVKSDDEAKAIEKNLVGNLFKTIYDSDLMTKKKALEQAMKQHGETMLTYNTLRTYIPQWIADMGIEDDGTDNQ